MMLNRPRSHAPWLFGLLLLVTPLSHAKQADFTQRLVINAKRQTTEIKENTVTFYGNVQVKQGTLTILADKLTVYKTVKNGQEVLIATGKPTTYQQQMDDGQQLHAKARSIKYELSPRTLTLTGDAQIRQQESLVQGEKIVYNLEAQRLEAESGGNTEDRVTTIFTPEQVKQQLDKKDDNAKSTQNNEAKAEKSSAGDTEKTPSTQQDNGNETGTAQQQNTSEAMTDNEKTKDTQNDDAENRPMEQKQP